MPRSWFECWRDPEEFFCVAWEQILLTRCVPPQYIRDAYVAGIFARISHYYTRCQVRLCSKQVEFPDAQLREGEHTIDLEIVIADKRDRPIWKEQKEFRQIYKLGEFPPIDCPEKRRNDLLEAIPRVVKLKAERHYNPQPNLLVYLMIAQTPLVSSPLMTVDEMAALTEPYKNNFKSIWILSEKEHVRAWPERKILALPTDQDPFDCSKEPA
jgi:hypothetical protein